MSCTNLTPVILTYNEQQNLGRTLEALRWAQRVVVLDSGSTDGTGALARSYSNVDWHHRQFDCHRDQWAYAMQQTNITSEWALALDADMIVPPCFVEEFENVLSLRAYAGGVIPFTYRTLGRNLIGSIYPPDLRVFRPRDVRIIQDGHTQRFLTDGPLYRFHSHIVHDDRKPLDRWVQSQLRYSSLELIRLLSARKHSGLASRLRRIGIMPPIAGLMAYVKAGGPFRGRAALEYAYERMTFECILAMLIFRN